MIYNIKSTLILLFSLICLVDFGLSWQCINQLISCPDLPSPLNGYRASDFNLIAFNDFFANNGEVQGRLAVGHDANIGSSFSIGYFLVTGGQNPPDNMLPYSLVVGNNLDWQGGGLYPDGSGVPQNSGSEEGIFVGNNMNAPSYLLSRRTGGPCSNCLNNDFSMLKNHFTTLASDWSTHATNAQYQLIYGEIVLESNQPASRYYVHIQVADLNVATSFSVGALDINAEYIIIIEGSGDVHFSGGSFNGFAGATAYVIQGNRRITVEATTVVGSIIAPDADLDNLNGSIDGFVVVNNVLCLNEVIKPNCPLPSPGK